MSEIERPDVAKVMDGLKDFQRATVEYVFDHLFLNPATTRRFLVADEVGLGKTLVARGVIARAIDHLWDDVKRIDIVYICSNTDIARQNINRLNIGIPQTVFATRITLLPIQVKQMRSNKVNFISITPGTSFDPRSSLGQMEERVLLYWLLHDVWNLGDRSGPRHVLQGNAYIDNFRRRINDFSRDTIDRDLAAAFISRLSDDDALSRGIEQPGIRARFDDLSQRFQQQRRRIPDRDRQDRGKLVGELRALLAATCLEALEPDLIILDEFQRFKHLLGGESEASHLARELFEFQHQEDASRAHVLLLSATPYKMYTRSNEPDGDDHYRDFVDTLAFLLDNLVTTGKVRDLLQRYRQMLFKLADQRAGTLPQLRRLRDDLENRLRSVMVRTERLAVTADRDGMLAYVPSPAAQLTSGDVRAYLAMQSVADLLSQGDILEYWKSAPYLFNFMDTYQLKQVFLRGLKVPHTNADIATHLAQADSALFPWNLWRAYEHIDPSNARLRQLLADTIERGAWRILWIPPALPYYQLSGPFADPNLAGFTKRLIFSAWQVAPRAIAMLASYDAERQMQRSSDPSAVNPQDAWNNPSRPLRLDLADGRPTGMPVFALMYPCATFAREIDPLVIGREYARSRGMDTLPAPDDMVAQAEERIVQLLDALPRSEESGPEDNAWYWAVPILLDLQIDRKNTSTWFERDKLASIWRGVDAEQRESEETSAWDEHVAHARQLLQGGLRLGRQPADLSRVLALLALAGPGTTMLRALGRVIVDAPGSVDARDAAARVGWAFRSMFNNLDIVAMLRGIDPTEPYWRRVLDYGLAGGVQAMLDEYVHVLRESLGLYGEIDASGTCQIAAAVCEALTLSTANLRADELAVDSDTGTIRRSASPRMRVRFAVRFGDQESEESGRVARSTQVRAAFNSPFWPFVLATTSIGQEGLDFHTYCHAIMHWNLPSNPVDLEQREGRIHRYKGHAVRKNVAQAHGRAARMDPLTCDPWQRAFDAACAERAYGVNDLVPYWIYPLPDGARIARYVPALPLSRDLERYGALRRMLTLYRLAFGQPRQEDLMEFLLAYLPDQDVSRMLSELQIDLSPPAHAL